MVVRAIVRNPTSPRREAVQGFLGSNGYVSMEAEHYSRAVAPAPIRWTRIPDLGRTLSGMTAEPVTLASQSPGGASARLEYRMWLLDSGVVTVRAYLSPTLNFSGAAHGLRYAMSVDDDPEVVTLPNDAGYVIVAVDRIVEAAPAPLAEIKDRVREDWIRRKASDRARAIASQIAAKVASGVAMEKAVADAGVPMPPVQPIVARRIQLAQADPNSVTALRMLFSLTQGKSRMVADPKDRGYFIVKTDKIVPGNALTAPGLIVQTQREFQNAMSDELGEELLAAMKADQGTKRNEDAIASARKRYSGADQ